MYNRSEYFKLANVKSIEFAAKDISTIITQLDGLQKLAEDASVGKYPDDYEDATEDALTALSCGLAFIVQCLTSHCNNILADVEAAEEPKDSTDQEDLTC